MGERRGQGHARAEFDHFVAETAETLLRSAYLIAWDFAEAEDLVQDCLFRIARRWPRVRKMEHPAAYARTVLVHLALDGGKGRGRRRAELGPASAVHLEASEDEAAIRIIGRVEASADLLRALGGLPPRQRVALVLRYFEDLSEADVADVMDCSIGTVKSTTSRALDRLREVMARPGVSLNHDDGTASPTSPMSTTSPTSTTTRAHTPEGSITG
jgi:RNA polymerase sigma-70 factor (sigma-E family)